MSVRYYDDAIYNKIKSWVKDERMKILKPEESSRLFQTISDMTNDKPITLPLISISRETSLRLNHSNKRPLTFDGLMVQATTEKSHQINAIPMTINYQIDIYTKKFKEGDEYLRNFVFNITNHPPLIIEIPYNNLKYTHRCNMRLSPEIKDNSDIPNRLFSGQFTRWTLYVTIDDAYLFSAPIETNVKIDDDVDVEVSF